MNKHASIQSHKDLPESLRFASKRYKRTVKNSKRRVQQLIRSTGKPINGRKGYAKSQVHRQMRRTPIESYI